MKTFQEFIEESESIADYFLKRGGKKPMSKAESDAALKARSEKFKRENPHPPKPEPYKEKYPLGGRDERSGRSYSEEASPMIKPPANEFSKKSEAFAHAKKHGGKVYKRTFTHPRTGQQHHTFFVKEDAEQIDEIMDVASTYKKIAVQHLRDMSAKDATQKQKDYAKAMNKRALEASKMSNHTDALNHYRGVKEEVEQIDEISQATKDSYVAKAKSEVDQLKSHVKGEYGGIVKRMIARRKKGIKLAQKKTNS